MVAGEDVPHSAAVRNDVTLELPCASQGMLEQELIGARWLTVGGVVGAHDRAGVSFNNSSAERREIRVFLIMAADVNVSEVTRRLRTAVHGEMFGGGNSQVIPRIIALQAGNK